MPLINWNEATASDLASFTAGFIREELSQCQLDNTGSKDEIIHRLLTDIAEKHERSQPETTTIAPGELPPSFASTARLGTAMPAFTADPVQNMQLLTIFLQQQLALTSSNATAQSVRVTTLPDLSSTILTFSGDGSLSASRWLEDLERTQQLAKWEPLTLLAITLGKL